MKRTAIFGFCITALVAFAAWAPNASAFTGRSSCISCHAINYNNTRHQNHRDAVNSTSLSCDICHDSSQVSATCAVCHDPAPLQTNHIDNYGVSSCEGCHPQAPVAETNCSDGIDNNNNGLTDCADPDCDGFVFVGQETTCGEGACAASGNLECRNEGQFDTCQPGSPGAEGPFDDASCSDVIDNDCDGLTDASDPDCAAPPEICDDGVDNNGNGLVDCADPQCDGFTFSDVTTCGTGACESTGSVLCQNLGEFDTCDPFTPGAEGPFDDASCSDNIDNDCDGSTDANDSDCVAPPEVCDDGVDNNGNGLVDCADPQCDGFVIPDSVTNCGQGACAATGNLECSNLGLVDTCQPGAPGNEGPYGDPSCSDGIDNDCNNQTDDADTNCQAGPEICDNNIDDNNDGLVDCADPQCDGFVGQPGSCTTSLPGICSAGTIACDLGETFCDQDTQAVTEGPFSSPTCNDGLDNDCDGSADVSDSDCDAPPVVCGDGIVGAGEQCDDGNDVNGDGCENDCTLTPPPAPFCGDGNVDAGEQCDDGNNVDGDGCENDCTLTPPPAPFCGDGNVDAGEQCDDGNNVDGDGCEADCTLTPPPAPFCGDGNVDAGEQCDDGNDVNGDGCENDCTLSVTGECNDGNLPVITEMEYNRGDEKLHIKGRATSGSSITITNSFTGQTLAEGIRVREGKWEAEIRNVGRNLKRISVISSNGCVVDKDVETGDGRGGYHDEDDDEHDERRTRNRRESRSDD